MLGLLAVGMATCCTSRRFLPGGLPEHSMKLLDDHRFDKWHLETRQFRALAVRVLAATCHRRLRDFAQSLQH